MFANEFRLKRYRAKLAAALGCDRLGIRIALVEEGHGLELVVAGPAVAEIGGAALAAFNPYGGGYRLATLRAGISSGQKAEFDSRHDACSRLLFWLTPNGTALLPDTNAPSRRAPFMRAHFGF